MTCILILWMFLVQFSFGKDVSNLFPSKDVLLRNDSDKATENRSMIDTSSDVLHKSPKIKVSRGPLRQMFPKYEEIEDISAKDAGNDNEI